MMYASPFALLPIYLLFSITFAEFRSYAHNDAAEQPKHKRVVYGTPLTDLNSYDVVGYFVHISLGSGWSWIWYHLKRYATLTLLDASIHPSPGQQLCGGALLTPSIVQTACHCLTNKWYYTPDVEPRYHYPTLKNGWEDLFVLHHGYTKVGEFQDGVWSRKFIAHSGCRTLNSTQELSHDFGWILTNRLLPEVPWIRKNNFAPVYTMTELALQYYEIMKREAVCLHVGFGKWYYADKRVGTYGEDSSLLMHGWRSVRNYWECYIRMLKASHFLYGETNPVIFKKDYIQDCSWSCTTFFGKQRSISAPGDSGSPVTCSDRYFGVMSYMMGKFGVLKHRTGANISVEMMGAIAFSMFENAAEYREAMTARMLVYARSHDDFPPDVLDVATVDPFNPNAFYPTKRTTFPPFRPPHPRSHSTDIQGFWAQIAVLQLATTFKEIF